MVKTWENEYYELKKVTDALRAENERLKEVLEFYATPENYDFYIVSATKRSYLSAYARSALRAENERLKAELAAILDPPVVFIPGRTPKETLENEEK